MSDTIRVLGSESDIDVIAALTPQAIADDTPVLSSAIDTAAYPRKRMFLIAQYNEVGATTHTMAFTVTESATSGGSYTASTTNGTLTAQSADAIQKAAIKVNPAKPFVKITATGSHADVDGVVCATVLFVSDSL
jgi:hypothetical protein